MNLKAGSVAEWSCGQKVKGVSQPLGLQGSWQSCPALGLLFSTTGFCYPFAVLCPGLFTRTGTEDWVALAAVPRCSCAPNPPPLQLGPQAPPLILFPFQAHCHCTQSSEQ